MSNKLVLLGGTLAFALLCLLCVFFHGPGILAEMNAPPLAKADTVAPPFLDAKLNNGKVILSGSLPNLEAKNFLLEKARVQFGSEQVVDQLKVDSKTGFPRADWLATVAGILPSVARPKSEGGFTAEGETLTIRGSVDSDAMKGQILNEVTGTKGTFQLVDKIVINGQVTAAQAQQFQQALNEQLIGKIVEFETGSDVITPRGKATLDEMVKVLGTVPGVPVEIGGHTDARGNAALNLALSKRRAIATQKYLIAEGIAESRLTPKGYGANKPIADNNTPEGQQKNRRIEFTVKREGN